VDTQILIVGAGPVGLTLAYDLGRRGISCVLVEQKEAPQFLPKMERCNARTMEMYRRLGLADSIRAAGLASDVPMDVYVVHSLDREPLLKLSYPSVDESNEIIRAVNDGTEPCEPYQLISQYTLEPLLKAAAETFDCVTLCYGTAFVDLEQDKSGVTATVRDTDGAVRQIRAAYLAGCDGGSSAVRKTLGIKLKGDGNLLQLRQALFYSEDLFDKIPIGDGPGKGRHYHVADDRATFLIMQDSTRHWTLHAVVDRDEDMKTQFEKAVGVPVSYEMLHVGEWRQNLLLADRYRDGRVFLAGDSVHLVIPTGGLGMNTGVGDALDLSWKLAAVLQGWGGPALLDSYEIERRAIGAQNVDASRYASQGRRRWRAQYRPNIADDTPEGRAAARNLARIADVEQRKTNEMIGAERGYCYRNSPIIYDEDGPEPFYDHREYIPTTYPGSRLPNYWLADGRPLQDDLAEGFTILRICADQEDTSELESRFRQLGVPVDVCDLGDPQALEVYGKKIIVLRPDLHVVWRGDRLSDMPQDLPARAAGHVTAEAREVTNAA
jgi:2-polyprenyl-6-methoxyphenol hydroxylase-like FAD-dependent oxidoreductase